MTPAALLSELRAAGAVLRVVGGRLEAKALPPSLAPLARAHAAELRGLLEEPDPAGLTPGPEDIEAAPTPAPAAGLDLAGAPLEAPAGFTASPPDHPPRAALPPFRWASAVRLPVDGPRGPLGWLHPLGDAPGAPWPVPAQPSRPPAPVALPPNAAPADRLAALSAALVAQLGPVRGRAPLAPPSSDVPPGAAGAWRAAYQRRIAAGLDPESAERLTNTTHGPRPA